MGCSSSTAAPVGRASVSVPAGQTAKPSTPEVTFVHAPKKVLIIKASARTDEESTSRQLADLVAEKATAAGVETVSTLNVYDVPFVNDAMADSFFARGERTDEQKAAVTKSDELVAQLVEHDTIVIATPMYNFGVPAALKSYIDLICRAGMTFAYGEAGPTGLLEGKQVVCIVCSGGVPLASPMDHVTPFLAFIGGFIGIKAMQVIDATKHAAVDPKEAVAALFARPPVPRDISAVAKPPMPAPSSGEAVLRRAPGKTLVVTASARSEDDSVSRKLATHFAEKVRAADGEVTVRDVNDLPYVNAAMVDSYFARGDRTDEQKRAVAKSDELVAELQAHDTIVFATPMYNFWLPAALKAYVDLITRVGVTFKYGEDGTPVGLVEGKQVFVIVASGGVPLSSPMDFLTPYMAFIMGFMGMSDVQVFGAVRGAPVDPKESIDKAFAAVSVQ